MLEAYIFYLQYHTTSSFKANLFLKSMCVVCFYKPNILSNSRPNGNAFEILSFPQQSRKKREGKLSGSLGNMPGLEHLPPGVPSHTHPWTRKAWYKCCVSKVMAPGSHGAHLCSQELKRLQKEDSWSARVRGQLPNNGKELEEVRKGQGLRNYELKNEIRFLACLEVPSSWTSLG